jgi:thiol-disulfide isomerase/thioredoxin
MNGLNGPNRTLKSFTGRRLIINLWASWCGPCRAEAASLERFAWSERGLKYTVIGISTDDDRKAAERWLRQSNATLTHFIDRGLILERLLGASSIPLTVLVDERGRVVSRVRGARAWDTGESTGLIERAFAEPGASRPP